MLRLGPGEKNFAGADRMCTPCRRCSEAYNGGGIICDVCGVTWWCSAHCRALDGDGHKATCHHVKLLGVQIKRDGMRALPFVQESGDIGCMFDLPREVVTRDDVGSAAANGDVAAIDRLLAQHGAAAAGATTAEHPVPPIVCAALQGHAKAVTARLRGRAPIQTRRATSDARPRTAPRRTATSRSSRRWPARARTSTSRTPGRHAAGHSDRTRAARRRGRSARRRRGPRPPLGPNAVTLLALAAQAAEKTLDTRPGSMIRAGTPCLMKASASTRPASRERVGRAARAPWGLATANAVSFLIDMPLVERLEAGRDHGAPPRRAGPPRRRRRACLRPLVDFATAWRCAAPNRGHARPHRGRRRPERRETRRRAGATTTNLRLSRAAPATRASGACWSKFGGFLAPSDVERRDRSDDMRASLTPLLALCHYRRRADMRRGSTTTARCWTRAPTRTAASAGPPLASPGRRGPRRRAVASALLAAGAEQAARTTSCSFGATASSTLTRKTARGGLALRRHARADAVDARVRRGPPAALGVTRLLRRRRRGGGRDRGELAAMGVKALKAELVRATPEHRRLLREEGPRRPPRRRASSLAAAGGRGLSTHGDAAESHPRRGRARRAQAPSALARRAPGLTAAARELVASCYLPGAPSIYDSGLRTSATSRAGHGRADAHWTTAVERCASRCAFQARARSSTRPGR